MTSVVHRITVDCTDAYELAGFWSEVTGHPRSEEDFPATPRRS
jgi:hypothetical protein